MQSEYLEFTNIAHDPFIANDYARVNTEAFTQAFSIVSAINHNITIDRSIAVSITTALDIASNRTKFIYKHNLLNGVDLPALISFLESKFNQSEVSPEELTTIISSSLDISPELLELSEDDVQVIANYLSTCQLMIDCSKQASGISAQQWETIKQRMFLPKPAE